MSTDLYLEQKVAGRLGIPRRDIKAVRDEILQKESGWKKIGAEVALTATGLGLVLKHLRLRGGVLDFIAEQVTDPAIEKKNWAAAPTTADHRSSLIGATANGYIELTVHRIWPNRHLLQAMTPCGELVDVRVKSNLNFRRKMPVRARLAATGRYELEGRCPRYPGRY